MNKKNFQLGDKEGSEKDASIAITYEMIQRAISLIASEVKEEY
jgi:hypothetical protein